MIVLYCIWFCGIVWRVVVVGDVWVCVGWLFVDDFIAFGLQDCVGLFGCVGC